MVSHFAFFAAGSIVLCATTHDLVRTTLGTSGAGPITGRVSHGIWGLLLRLHRRRPSHRLLSGVGPTLLAFTVFLWTLLVWSGWFLIFSADASSVVHTFSRQPADVVTRAAIVASTMFTGGGTDWVPSTRAWHVAAALATGSGIASLTVSLTYILEVLAAVVTRRSFGAYVASIGGTADRLLTNAWNGQRCEALDQHLIELTGLVYTLTQQQLAYPIVHYFHNDSAPAAATTRLAALHELLLVVEQGFAPRVRPPRLALVPLCNAIRHAADVLRKQFIVPAPEPPPPPSLRTARELDVPLVDEGTFVLRVAEFSDTRRALLGMLHNDGWSWSDVFATSEQR